MKFIIVLLFSIIYIAPELLFLYLFYYSRFSATGELYPIIAFKCRFGQSTVQNIVLENCAANFETLLTKWLQISNQIWSM